VGEAVAGFELAGLVVDAQPANLLLLLRLTTDQDQPCLSPTPPHPHTQPKTTTPSTSTGPGIAKLSAPTPGNATLRVIGCSASPVVRDVKLGVTAGQLKVSTASKTRLFDVVGAPYGVKVEVTALNASGSADWSGVPKSCSFTLSRSIASSAVRQFTFGTCRACAACLRDLAKTFSGGTFNCQGSYVLRSVARSTNTNKYLPSAWSEPAPLGITCDSTC